MVNGSGYINPANTNQVAAPRAIQARDCGAIVAPSSRNLAFESNAYPVSNPTGVSSLVEVGTALTAETAGSIVLNNSGGSDLLAVGGRVVKTPWSMGLLYACLGNATGTATIQVVKADNQSQRLFIGGLTSSILNNVFYLPITAKGLTFIISTTGGGAVDLTLAGLSDGWSTQNSQRFSYAVSQNVQQFAGGGGRGVQGFGGGASQLG
jgi:hypothetical protein